MVGFSGVGRPQPSLMNLSGTSSDENVPLRDQPPVVNTVAGAMEIPELIDNFEWVGQSGEIVPYAVNLRRAPLVGLEPKSVIVQFAREGRTVPNLTTTAILRAGELADRATYYRFDLFLDENPATPASINDSHSFRPVRREEDRDLRLGGERGGIPGRPHLRREEENRGSGSSIRMVRECCSKHHIAPPLPEEVVFFP